MVQIFSTFAAQRGLFRALDVLEWLKTQDFTHFFKQKNIKQLH